MIHSYRNHAGILQSQPKRASDPRFLSFVGLPSALHGLAGRKRGHLQSTSEGGSFESAKIAPATNYGRLNPVKGGWSGRRVCSACVVFRASYCGDRRS